VEDYIKEMEGLDQRTVLLSNISPSATELQLHTALSAFGETVCIKVKYNRDTGLCKGFGFAEYTTEESAMAARNSTTAIDLNGIKLRIR